MKIMANHNTNNETVNDMNYDVAICVAVDKKGNSSIGWIDNEAGDSVVAKNSPKFEVGENNEHQASVLSLMAEKLTDMVEKGTVKKGSKVLLVLSDSVAPRFFEARNEMLKHSISTEDEIEEATNAVIAKISKGWMPQYWLDALADLACAYAYALSKGAKVGATKKSQLTEKELAPAEKDTMPEDPAIKAGARITVGEEGKIAESTLYVAPYVHAGEYTVIDRSYQSKKGKILQYAVNRWENVEFIPNSVNNLIDLNKAVSDRLPKVKKLTVRIA